VIYIIANGLTTMLCHHHATHIVTHIYSTIAAVYQTSTSPVCLDVCAASISHSADSIGYYR